MRATITEAVVAGAKTGFIRDDRVIGFGLRMTTNGFKAFIVEARVQGRVRRFTIGPATGQSPMQETKRDGFSPA